MQILKYRQKYYLCLHFIHCNEMNAFQTVNTI